MRSLGKLLLACFGMGLLAAIIVAMVGTTGPAGAQTSGTNFQGFRGPCFHSHTAVADPIAQTMHEHLFFGNTTTNEDSNLQSLQQGQTNCRRPSDRSAYWMPNFTVNGQQMQPGFAGFYFQSLEPMNQDLTRPFPQGFKMIASDENGDVRWACTTNQGFGNVQPSPPVDCPANSGLGLMIKFPECWDGEPAGADNQHSVVEAVAQPNGIRGCPSHHPKQLPTLTMWPDFKGDFQHPIEVQVGHHGESGPAAMHADVFVAFEHENLVQNCINGNGPGDLRPAICDGNNYFK